MKGPSTGHRLAAPLLDPGFGVTPGSIPFAGSESEVHQQYLPQHASTDSLLQV